MKISRAIITAAGRDGQTLPLQRVVDRDGVAKTALQIIVEEAVAAGADEVGIIVRPGDETAFRQAAGGSASQLELIPQPVPLGYGHAIRCGRAFAADEPVLHLVGDHLYVSDDDGMPPRRCARQLVAVAEAENCSVSAVQATRESMLPYFGTIGGRRVAGSHGLYEVETVVEKPTPTQAEQDLIVPGLRAGHYLCFFGMHVLTPVVFDLLDALGTKVPDGFLRDCLRQEKHRIKSPLAERQDALGQVPAEPAEPAVGMPELLKIEHDAGPVGPGLLGGPLRGKPAGEHG